MDWFSKSFIKAGLCWLGIGVLVGLAMAARGPWAVYRPVHAHLNLLGFVVMTIYGVAYHVIPRFTGHPLHSPRLAVAQWWLANTGLVVLTSGFVLGTRYGARLVPVTVAGGIFTALAAWTFIYNMWRTLDGGPKPPPPSAGRRLNVMDQ